MYLILFSKSAEKSSDTQETVVKHIDISWSLDLLNMVDYGQKHITGYGLIILKKWMGTIVMKLKF